jgi:hypothetical protein
MSSAALVKRLQERITIVRDFDANTPLKDALDYLADHFQIVILIDTQAFKDEMNDEGGPEVETRPVALRKPSDYTMAAALRLVFAQAHATYLIRNGVVEVTTLQAASPGRLLQHRVMATFEKKPLNEALQELAEASGMSIIVDPRAEQAATPVTATLKNDVSLHTAVRLLADMADLKAVQVGGALYVTTKENAAVLQAEEDKLRKAEMAAAKRAKKSKAVK